MKFTYEPQSGDDDITTIFGKTVEAGDSIDASDLTEAQVAKLKNHPEFNSGSKSESKAAADRQAKEEQKLAKAIDGRSKEARQAREKAEAATAEAEAKERAEAQARAIAEARESSERD